MSRGNAERLEDILAACDAISEYLLRGPAGDALSDGMVFDAVMRRLEVIGEAVKGLDKTVQDEEPDVPWRRIAGMRDHIAHRYWDTAHGIISGTVTDDVPRLRAAVERLLARPDSRTDVD